MVSGIIAGMVDSFFVGETEIDKEKIQKTLEEKYNTVLKKSMNEIDELNLFK